MSNQEIGEHEMANTPVLLPIKIVDEIALQLLYTFFEFPKLNQKYQS